MKFLQFFYSNANGGQNVNQIQISEACLNVIEKAGIFWFLEFICHYQNFDSFKFHLCQRWHIEKHIANKFFKEDLLITCHTEEEQSKQSDTIILEKILVENFAFPFEHLTLLYQSGFCLLPEEEAQYSTGCT